MGKNVTFWPKSMLMTLLLRVSCCAVMSGHCSFLYSMKAFKGFLMYGRFLVACWLLTRFLFLKQEKYNSNSRSEAKRPVKDTVF